LATHHLRILTIIGFPTATFPGLLDELNRLAFPYRWSTRAIMLDKTDATKLLTKIRRQWFAKRKSGCRDPQRGDDQRGVGPVDSDASNKAADADMALQELGADCWPAWPMSPRRSRCGTPIPRIADEKLRLVEKVIQGRDFTAIPEGMNAVEAWLGSLPGHAYANVRQPPISTLNLAHMIPLSPCGRGRNGTSISVRPPCSMARPKARPRSGFRFMSAMSATR
jgi:type IV secretory pathway VirB4 component